MSVIGQEKVDNKSKTGLSKREKRKAERDARQLILFEEAREAIENKSFVLEAYRVDFDNGTTVNLNKTTNFVSLDEKKGTIQLAFDIPKTGLNGLGGVTVDGAASSMKKKINKRGDLYFSFIIQGTLSSATVEIYLTKGNNDCRATITPNLNGQKISFRGELIPFEKSNIFKGRSI